MEKEFDLSKKIETHFLKVKPGLISVEDIKEFIRLLKKELEGEEIYDKYEIGNSEELIKFIDKLAGEQLV